MKKIKAVALILTAVMLVTMLCSCSVSDLLSKDEKTPEAVTVKTDLKDAVFTFTYKELKETLTAEKVAAIFEDFDELNDDVTIDMSYNDIVNRFEGGEDDEDFKKMMALCTGEELAQLTDNSAEVLEYVVNALNGAKAKKPVVEYSEGFWTDKGSIIFTQNGEESDSRIKQAAKYFEYFVTKGAGDFLSDSENGKSGKTEQGADLTDIMYLYGEEAACRLTMDDVESVISSLAYDKEAYKEHYTDENGREKTRDAVAVTGITRIVKIKLKNTDEAVLKAFSVRDKSVVLDEMKKASDYISVDDYNIAFDGCTITLTFNAVTDNILTAEYDRNMDITTEVTGVGSLEHLGTQNLSFKCTDRVNYHFGWAEEAK